MPRQIVPVSDVASILLTQDEGDLRYLPLSYVPPATDLSNYWTKAQADGRYEPLDSAYTKAEADAMYALTGHLHTGVYQPVGSYSLTSHDHAATYVDVTGDSMTGNLGVGVTPAAWDTATFSAVQVGGGGSIYGVKGTTNETVWFASNSYISPSGAGDKPIIGGKSSSRIQMVGGQVTFQAAPAVAAGVSQAFVPTLDIIGTGTVEQHAPSTAVAEYRFRSPDAMWANIQFNRNDNTPRLLFGKEPTTANLALHTYDDVGAYLGRAFVVERLSRSATFDKSLTVNDTLYVTNYIMSGNGAAAYCWHTPTGLLNAGNNMLLQSSNNIVFQPEGTYLHPYANNAVNFGHAGIRWATIYTQVLDAAGDAVCGGNITLYGGICRSGNPTGQYVDYRYDGMWKNSGDLLMDAGPGAMIKTWTNATAIAPAVHGGPSCGTSSLRWSALWSTAGSINTSVAASKKGFKPLDPVACTAAVLETDWLSYEYLPPPPPERSEEDTNQERMAVLDEYLAKQAETAFARKQNGYVLGHPTHKTHDLFGLADRQSASPSADLGILACALQSALQRIAILEGKPV